MPANLENSASGHRTAKRSVFITIPKKSNAKECSNYHTIAFIERTDAEAEAPILRPPDAKNQLI